MFSLVNDLNGCYVKRSDTGWAMVAASLACLPDPAGAATPPGDTVRAGHEVVYTLTVRNDGPAPAREVVVRDPIDERLEFRSATPSSCGYRAGTLTCGLGRLDVGESVTFEWRGRVAPDTPDGYVLHNVAKVSTPTPEARLSNNTAHARITVVNRPATARSTAEAASSGATVETSAKTITVAEPGTAGGTAGPGSEPSPKSPAKPSPRTRATPAGGPDASGGLPFTGALVWPPALASLLLVAGLAVLWAVRRRREPRGG
ncbi:hypothetical protein Ssi03_01550 [Sphaerisporangium siamense]|uniref:Putative repeat protein (TIGR01451 family) n=1 Tax=Sphaerisporangium siamense TaxID=795645 RepID=A0A7W7DBB7_9ACTN|nr:DUF11 domain-containing protein [Sphaerisporangium siamense]MBB4703693.1 putative repeat protein (TIGR01451 family) [Sphaerisporangium siamense]GII82165.1 hypothetical protein Ssi03_01550 [Sphaerisporangium siamense]